MTTKTTGTPAAKAPATVPAGASPEALLKAAVSGAAAPSGLVRARRLNPLLAGIAGGGLALGLICGAGITAASLARSGSDPVAEQVRSSLEAARAETLRLTGEMDRLGRTLTALHEADATARKDAARAAQALADRLGKVELSMNAKLASLGERIEQAGREQGAQIAALGEKHAAATPPPPRAEPAKVEAAKVEAVKAEPTQTGSIGERRAAVPERPPVIETWAVRDVYDGTAILEDRRRRLVEVVRGDSVPGIGRVEALERRGRDWVVVTRQGLITPQPW